MKIETKKVYTTTDERSFINEHEARQHEINLAINLLEENLTHFNCGNCPAREICEWINGDTRQNCWDKQLCQYLN